MLYCLILRRWNAVGSVFFFKQKTAYEMRISDWSSDVCSSDLAAYGEPAAVRRTAGLYRQSCRRPRPAVRRDVPADRRAAPPAIADGRAFCAVRRSRSEEHTSELQSLMRISYAVFCLKKKTQNNTNYELPKVTNKNLATHEQQHCNSYYHK